VGCTEIVPALLWHPSRVQLDFNHRSGGLRYAATPGYRLAALRAVPASGGMKLLPTRVAPQAQPLDPVSQKDS